MSKTNESSNSDYQRANSIESGYESDTQTRESKGNLPQVVVNAIASFREGMNSMKGYISDELIKVAANNNGVVDINNTEFQVACKALLESDPTISSGAYSVLAEVNGIEEQINRLIVVACFRNDTGLLLSVSLGSNYLTFKNQSGSI